MIVSGKHEDLEAELADGKTFRGRPRSTRLKGQERKVVGEVDRSGLREVVLGAERKILRLPLAAKRPGLEGGPALEIAERRDDRGPCRREPDRGGRPVA